ncbi:MAG: hypothetical protein BroJett003_23610 [Planctomycetota bacterium]|nr:MAG: hypothetical protein BroJett003_23610 [Planctomycetota bacterium]
MRSRDPRFCDSVAVIRLPLRAVLACKKMRAYIAGRNGGARGVAQGLGGDGFLRRVEVAVVGVAFAAAGFGEAFAAAGFGEAFAAGRIRRGGCGGADSAGASSTGNRQRVVSGAAAAGSGGVTGQWIRHRFQNVFSFVSSLPGSTCS